MPSFRLSSTAGDQSFELRARDPLVVGRALGCDIPIFDATVSRRHAELVCDDDGISIRDLGSSNGTWLNGERVTDGHATPGDVLAFGHREFRVDTLEQARESEPAPRAVSTPVEPTIVRERRVANSQGASIVPKRARSDEATGSEEAIGSIDTPNAAAHRLALLLDVSKGLARSSDTDALLDRIAGFVFQILDVDRVAIMLADERGELTPKVSRDRYGADAGRAVPTSIARRVMQEKVAVLSDNAPEDQRFGGQSILAQRVRSAMCAPLIGSEDRVHGVLYVDNLTATHRFTDEDLDFLVAFSGIAAVALENSAFAQALRREALVRSNFERYFAPSLASRIAAAPDAVRLGGAQRFVAVLFSDIRGFTALAESLAPDDLARQLSEYLTAMTDCVFRHDGTLDKFIGDSVMAQWGAPIANPDDADKAVRAALDMMDALHVLNDRWASEGRPTLGVGIGLDCGDVFAGNIGSERRLEYTVIGDAVNTAAGLCAAAEPGEILLTDAMRRRLTITPPLVEAPPLQLKRKGQPVPVFRVRGRV